MDLHELTYAERTAAASPASAEPRDRFQVVLSLAVSDGEALWDAAAAKALAAPGARLSDVIDVIGPREDPAIAECIAMLAQPAAMPGCDFDSFEVEAVVCDVQPQPRGLKAA